VVDSKPFSRNSLMAAVASAIACVLLYPDRGSAARGRPYLRRALIGRSPASAGHPAMERAVRVPAPATPARGSTGHPCDSDVRLYVGTIEMRYSRHRGAVLLVGRSTERGREGRRRRVARRRSPGQRLENMVKPWVTEMAAAVTRSASPPHDGRRLRDRDQDGRSAPGRAAIGAY